jgi:hypothetical protein
LPQQGQVRLGALLLLVPLRHLPPCRLHHTHRTLLLAGRLAERLLRPAPLILL